jgi:hypothetical protein
MAVYIYNYTYILTTLTSLLHCCHFFFSVYCYFNNNFFVVWCWLRWSNLYVLVLFFLPFFCIALWCYCLLVCVCVCRCGQCMCACMHVHCVDQHTCWPDKPIGSKYIIRTTVILWHIHGMLVVYTDCQYMEQNRNCRKKIFKRSINFLQFTTTLKNTFLQWFICKLCLVIPDVLLKESRTKKTPKMVHEM